MLLRFQSSIMARFVRLTMLSENTIGCILYKVKRLKVEDG